MRTLRNIRGNVQTKLHDKRWQSDNPTIQYKKGSLNIIADSLSRLRTGENYNYDIPLHNAKPLILKKNAEINMVTTHAKSAEQDQLTPKLLDLQIKVWDIFKTLDIHQLIMNAETVLYKLEPAKLRELQNQNQSIINLKNSRKQSVIADRTTYFLIFWTQFNANFSF